MFQQTDQSKLDIPGENSLSIKGIQTGSPNSHVFRNILVDQGYRSFNGKSLKGELCYDSYYKDFTSDTDLKYTIYCYCYDLKDLMEDPELFEFCFECQIETGKGIIGIESVQWNFTNPVEAKNNLEYFHEKIDIIWKSFGSKKFPS